MHFTTTATALLALVGSAFAADVKFATYTASDCAGGAVIFDVNQGNKGNFGATQRSVKALNIANGKHIVFYSGQNQSGTLTRVYTTNVCADGNFLSWGVYANN